MDNPLVKHIPIEDMYLIIQDALMDNKKVSFTVRGTSMQPMLYNNRDTVTLEKAVLPLKKYDLPFYRLDNGKFILHRVINIHKDGTYECRGDNRWASEDNIRDDQIIAVVTSFTRNGKTISVHNFWYLLYVKTWKFFHFLMKCYQYAQKRIKF